MGQKQTSRHVHVMSVIPLKADIHQRGLHVRLVPVADVGASPPCPLPSSDERLGPRRVGRVARRLTARPLR
jgi:hypothetical protein